MSRLARSNDLTVSLIPARHTRFAGALEPIFHARPDRKAMPWELLNARSAQFCVAHDCTPPSLVGRMERMAAARLSAICRMRRHSSASSEWSKFAGRN